MARFARESSMSSTGPRSPFKLVDVDDLQPASTNEVDLIGRRIDGRYTILAHLGGGGMADVYRASDDQLAIDVAIKILKPEMASSELRARMIQEAQAAAQVRHPNLVRVFGTGRLDDTTYIAMELLDGPNLEDHLRVQPNQRLPWAEALGLLLPTLSALHAIHERGYIHRDIKPGNILIARDPGCPPRAVVIDLGLVKPDRALRTAASPPTTEVGRVLCTPGFTSPEQASGLPVDRRSDIYSLAIALYRVLAGRLPFHDARGQPLHVVFDHHINNPPTRLIVAAGDAKIPPAIGTVIEGALAKDPDDRPPTMLAFADALQAAAASTRPAQLLRLQRWPSALLLALAAIVALAVWLTTRPTRGPEPELKAVATRKSAAPRTPPGDPPPAPAALPTLVDPPATPTPVRDDPPARRPDPASAARKILARHTDAVQQCADQATGSLERLAVAFAIDTAGHVTAHADGAADTPLSRCLDRALRPISVPPPPRPLSFVHTFKLRATP